MKNDELAQERKRTILRIIHGFSSEVPCSSEVLENVLSVGDSQVRLCIAMLRQEGHPVCSNNKGYWLSTKKKDIESTLKHLQARIDHIDKVIAELKRYLKEKGHGKK